MLKLKKNQKTGGVGSKNLGRKHPLMSHAFKI